MVAMSDSMVVAIVAISLLIGVVVVIISVWFIPRWLAGRPRTDRQVKQRELENSIRGTILQAVAGTLFLVTASVAFVRLQEDIHHNKDDLALRFAEFQEDIQHNRQDFQVTADKQLADRFSQAISQLGTQNNIDVRLGGIYALHRIGSNSPSYRRALVEIYCAFVRAHSPWPPRSLEPKDSGKNQSNAKGGNAAVQPLQTRAPDIQTVMRILGGIKDRGQADLDLTGTDLRRANLRVMDLNRALFYKSNLSGANLTRTDLRKASLVRAILANAVLKDADLQGANLSASNLKGANLLDAHFDNKTQWKGTKSDCKTKWPDDESKKAAMQAGALVPASCSG
jgi:hypothetical protein